MQSGRPTQVADAPLNDRRRGPCLRQIGFARQAVASPHKRESADADPHWERSLGSIIVAENSFALELIRDHKKKKFKSGRTKQVEKIKSGRCIC